MEFIQAKTIISSYTENGWFGSNYNMNIYRGCCHGCIYCDSRSDCYQIENFDTVRAKKDALGIIESELSKKRKKGIVITGSMSDGYNPFEKQYELTRGALKLIDRYTFGIVIDTKSNLVTRDIDILTDIQRHSPVAVNFTVTSASDDLSRKIEQHVCTSGERFAAIKKLSQAGIKCGILLMPVLPFICDNEKNIRDIIKKAADSGASWIYSGYGFGVTLRQNQREYYLNKIEHIFSHEMKQKYIDTYGYNYSCTSPDNEKLWKVFREVCAKNSIEYDMDRIIKIIKKGYEYTQTQISMF